MSPKRITAPRAKPFRGVPRTAGDDGWRTWAPLGFVILALAALVVVPVAGHRHTQPLHAEMRQVSEPGRSLVTRIQLALAIQGSVLHDYLETRHANLVDRYRQSASEEQAAYVELAPLVAQLGPRVREHFDTLSALQTAWHNAVDVFLARDTTGAMASDPLRQDLYEDLLVATARLDESITEASQGSRARILGAERLLRQVTIALGIVGLVAVAVVAWLGSRLRLFAHEANRRRVDLELATESRARLMRGISHDLKNPLNAIDGHAQLLEDGLKGPLSPGQTDSISRIRKAVRSLLGLIDDLLELSRAEAGQLRIAPRTIALGDVVREAAEEHRAFAEASQHRIEVVVANDLPPVVSDPDRVRQVLGNLLSNAVKYTSPGGRISIRAELASGDGRGDGHRWTAVHVIDSGAGIPADKLDAIFAEFSRLEIHEHKPGAGLGLSIARRIANLLGGDITVASEEGEGSVFTLWLPTDRREG